MASDRGTLPRGADQQAPWAGPTTPAGRRPPSAPRERRPVLAVLAVLLIVGGALTAGLLVVRSGQRVGAIEITQPVRQGAQIPASAIAEVHIAADSGVSYVSWRYAREVPQYFATMPIPKGTLLNNGMLEKTNSLPNGRAEVGLALKDGQLPVDLQAGDKVRIYSTQLSSASAGCPGKPGGVLTYSATVISVTASPVGAGTTDVVVAMNPVLLGPVLCNSANGTAAVAITSGTGAG